MPNPRYSFSASYSYSSWQWHLTLKQVLLDASICSWSSGNQCDNIYTGNVHCTGFQWGCPLLSITKEESARDLGAAEKWECSIKVGRSPSSCGASATACSSCFSCQGWGSRQGCSCSRELPLAPEPSALRGRWYFLIKERATGSCLANSLLCLVSALPTELSEGLLSLKEQGKKGRLYINKFWQFVLEAECSQQSVLWVQLLFLVEISFGKLTQAGLCPALEESTPWHQAAAESCPDISHPQSQAERTPLWAAASNQPLL